MKTTPQDLFQSVFLLRLLYVEIYAGTMGRFAEALELDVPPDAPGNLRATRVEV